MYYKYLYKEFLNMFQKYFTFKNYQYKLKCHFYNLGDENFWDFLIETIQSLEPIRESANIIIYLELEEFSEVIFFLNGSVKIGFEINR